jgi:hypothetical protein
MPEMIEVLGLKERLGEVTDLRLAPGKTAWGQKIVYPYRFSHSNRLAIVKGKDIGFSD